MEPVSDTLLIRITGDTSEEVLDRVAAEAPCTLIVNGEELVSLLCSPIELENMAVGFLLSEGLLSSKEALQEIIVDEKDSTVRVALANLPDNWQDSFQKKTITSGCGKGITFTNPGELQSLNVRREPIHLTTNRVKDLLIDFKKLSKLYISTGGVHSAALADHTGIILFSEDIGRHNAVDKLIGKAFLQEISLEDKILLSSGRISGEIMTKIIRNKIPVLITRTAPTCMSISYAEDYGVTLIGFARGNRMNIYTHPCGVVFDNLTDHGK